MMKKLNLILGILCASSSLPLHATPQIGMIYTGANPRYISKCGTHTQRIEHTVTNNGNGTATLTLPNLPQGVTPAHSLTTDSCFTKSSDTSFLLTPGAACRATVEADSAAIIGTYGLDGSNLAQITAQFKACIGGNASACFRPPQAQEVTLVVSSFCSSVSQLALSVSDTALNAALTGTRRNITITNSTRATINNITASASPALPTGTSIAIPGACSTLAPQASCTIQITPGATPSAPSDASDPSSIFSTLTITGDNATPITVDVAVLGYGSQYQSGYVFSIDDTTPASQSAIGTITSLVNQAPLFPLGIIWASNGTYGCPHGNNKGRPCTNYDIIPGINELSTTIGGDACNGSTDGACNTAVIVNYLNHNNLTTPGKSVDQTAYAAGLCKATIGGYTDWYLPAICEMGYLQLVPGTTGPTNNCGTVGAPLLQNMASNLTTQIVASMQGPFWSSTEYSGHDGSDDNAWDEYFTTNVQTHDGKEDQVGVRCVRKLTQPS